MRLLRWILVCIFDFRYPDARDSVCLLSRSMKTSYDEPGKTVLDSCLFLIARLAFTFDNLATKPSRCFSMLAPIGLRHLLDQFPVCSACSNNPGISLPAISDGRQLEAKRIKWL
jgi:hypothetical protein